jgi:protein-L-isoaspartate(D-aspartate) O-methyltransferase
MTTNQFIDTYKHKGQRKMLIEELRKNNFDDEKILAAFDAVPRHYFLELAFEKQAYSNTAFQIGSGQTISHPTTVAFQTYLLNVQKGDKILEIGTGSGFQTAILCQLGARVVSIERHHELHLKAKKVIQHLNFLPKLFFGDGFKGSPMYAPYDKVLVTCGAPEIPATLVEQLKVGGVMVIPVGEGVEQKMLYIVKQADNSLEIKEYGTFKFVPMLERTVK